MNQEKILSAFLVNNVLCHTDADVIDDYSNHDDLDDAAYGWAESLKYNLMQVTANESSSLKINLVEEVLEYFQSCDKKELMLKILLKYPENIDWLFDAETEKAFENILVFFLANWKKVNS